MSLVPPPPFVTVTEPEQAIDWWPPRPRDPRRSHRWARGTRRPDDGITFLGCGEGPALWVRPSGDGRAPARQDAVEVCTGAVAEVPCDQDLLARARATYRRQLVAGANGYVSPLIANREVRHDELLRLVAAMVDTAGRDGAVPAFLNCPDGDPLLDPLRQSGFATGVTDLYAVIDLPGDCFDDYLAALPSHNRRNIRRERRQLAPATAHTYRGELARPYLGQAAELVAAAYAARSQQRDADDVRDSYGCLLDAFGEDFLMCIVDLAGAPVASACLLAGDGELLVYSAGLRQPAAREVAGYFNAVYYEPIEYAYEHGARRLLFGPTSTRAKALRGATFTPMLSAVPASCEPLVTALAATDAAMRAELAGLTGATATAQ